jgi:CheY-like chemotaxis protein/HPt (histidine-containing phosphotransfer) domain-containing protein
MDDPNAAVESVLIRLTAEFIDGCADRLDDLDAEIRRLADEGGDAGGDLFNIRRTIHSIKGQAGTFGFPTIGHIAHALEDYIEAIQQPSAEHLDDIQMHLDTIRAIAERRENPSDEEAGKILRRLPSAVARMTVTQPIRDIGVLLVMPKNVQRSIIGEELAGCGFKVRTADRAVQAIDLALVLRPDVVVAGMVIDDMSGAELARVLATMEATRDCRFALVTTSAADDPRLGELPPNAAVVRKGRHFAEDLSEIMIEWEIFGPVGIGAKAS